MDLEEKIQTGEMVSRKMASPEPGGYREMARIAFPLIMGMASYTVMQFCDRVFLSRYSSVTIQAALPAGSLSHTFVCFFQAVVGYSGTFAAHFFGAKQYAESLRATVQGFWFSIFFWPLMVLSVPLGYWFMTICGHSAEVLDAEKVYFGILTAGGIMPLLNAAIGGYFMGVGKTMVNCIANAVACSLNILLNYIMIFGHWGCPEMGITGAAYATLISGGISFILQLAAISADRHVREALRRYRLNILLPDIRLFRRILFFGTPAGVQALMDVGAFSIFILLTGHMGALALTASNIAFSINHLAFAPLLAFGLATSTVVSQHMGAKNIDAANRAGYTGLKMGLMYMGAIGLTFILFPRAYFELFRPSGAAFSADALLQTGRVMLYMMTGWGILDTVTIILGHALKGAGDTRFVMVYITMVGWLLLIPGTLFLLWRGSGIIGLWAWLAVYVAVLSFGFFRRWHRGSWKRISLVGDHHMGNISGRKF